LPWCGSCGAAVALLRPVAARINLIETLRPDRNSAAFL
jgi:hypothetical protein